jgi:Pyridoxal-phosphate dependent enzyme
VSPTIDTRPRAHPRARRVLDDDELTPVELVDGLAYKRDDLFKPYRDVELSGGKVRQARRLLRPAAERIRREHGGVVLTATGVHSPQGLIIARVAAELELRCVLFVGATTRDGALSRHRMLRTAVEHGAELDCSAGVAYESALAAAQQRWRDEHDGAGYVVRFGINLEDDPDAILGSTAAQVANVPDDARTIVVAVGAGVTAAGVVLGALEHRPRARVVCVQIAGYDRRDAIDRMTDGAAYDWHVVSGVPYARHVRASVAPGFELDPIYEAKAWHYMRAELELERACFWVVGDSRAVR